MASWFTIKVFLRPAVLFSWKTSLFGSGANDRSHSSLSSCIFLENHESWWRFAVPIWRHEMTFYKLFWQNFSLTTTRMQPRWKISTQVENRKLFKVKASFACGAYYTLDLSTPEKERMAAENHTLLLHLYITIEVGSEAKRLVNFCSGFAPRASQKIAHFPFVF